MEDERCSYCYLLKKQRKPLTGSWNSFCSLHVPEPVKEKAPSGNDTQGESLRFCTCFDGIKGEFPELHG